MYKKISLFFFTIIGLQLILYQFQMAYAIEVLKTPKLIYSALTNSDNRSLLCKIKKIISGEILYIEKIDFNGDRKEDYIVTTLSEKASVFSIEGYDDKKNVNCSKVDNNQPCLFEYWVTSNYKIVKKKVSPADFGALFHYRWFINLDSDDEPEEIMMIGWEDETESFICDYDLTTFHCKSFINFYPILTDLTNRKYFSGLPDAIDNIILNNKKEILCSFDYKTLLSIIQSDLSEEFQQEALKEAKANNYPAIFFSVKMKQKNLKLLEIKKTEWLPLNLIVKKAIGKTYYKK